MAATLPLVYTEALQLVVLFGSAAMAIAAAVVVLWVGDRLSDDAVSKITGGTAFVYLAVTVALAVQMVQRLAVLGALQAALNLFAAFILLLALYVLIQTVQDSWELVANGGVDEEAG